MSSRASSLGPLAAASAALLSTFGRSQGFGHEPDRRNRAYGNPQPFDEGLSVAGIRVGLMDPVMAARGRVDAVSRASYLGAVANRVDSYWVPDHINGQTPRSLWEPKYTVAARMLRSPDAAMEA